MLKIWRKIMVLQRLKRIRGLPQDATYDQMDSPVGDLTLITSPEGLHAILWDMDRKSQEYKEILRDLIKSPNEKTILKTKKQLAEFFQKKRKKFDLPLVFNGTAFQIKAWKQLLKIPYGKTISYGAQAEKVGNKNKARAVGMANGLNPISIVIPCHRVIGSNGDLVGFGGGIGKKAYLLNLEKAM
jgi:methylated-DNA-[protein]-cysteine S-methyltransferase